MVNPNRYSHPGVSGPKPKLTTLVKRALAKVDQNLPQIFQALIERALEGDREAQIYLIDRRLGKPKSEIDITGGESLGVGIVTQIYTLMAERRRELDALQGQSEAKELPEATYEEEEDSSEAK